MKNSVLHLSHTDIRQDNRIIKELELLKNEFVDNDFYAIGIIRDLRLPVTNLSLLNVKDLSISLITKKIYFVPKFIKNFLNYFEFFFKCFFKIYCNRIKIVHCHDFTALTIGYMAKIFLNTKLIYDSHELQSQKSHVTYPKLFFFFEKFFWTKIDLFITVSPSILKWYHNKFGYKKNSITIFNFPKKNKKNFSKKNYLRKKFNIPSNKLVFLFIGFFRPHKGIEIALKAFSNSLIKSHLVFVGTGELENDIKKFSKKLSNIHISKPVDYRLINKYIQSADVGLCLTENTSLSRYYSLSNKFFSYALAGLYILASNFPDMKKFVNLYSLGKCIKPNYKILIKTIKHIENNKIKIKIKRKKLKALEWDSQSKILLNAYTDLLN